MPSCLSMRRLVRPLIGRSARRFSKYGKQPPLPSCVLWLVMYLALLSDLSATRTYLPIAYPTLTCKTYNFVILSGIVKSGSRQLESVGPGGGRPHFKTKKAISFKPAEPERKLPLEFNHLIKSSDNFFTFIIGKR